MIYSFAEWLNYTDRRKKATPFARTAFSLSITPYSEWDAEEVVAVDVNVKGSAWHRCGQSRSHVQIQVLDSVCGCLRSRSHQRHACGGTAKLRGGDSTVQARTTRSGSNTQSQTR
jgi:hypothetical protein